MTDYKKEYLYAQMSTQAYSDHPQAPAGWQVVPGATVSDKQTGFAATAFQNPATKEMVIAYRGTDDLKDIAADNAIAGLTSDWNRQFAQGLDYAKHIMDAHPEAAGKISVTGHSLGGALAQVSAQMYGFKGITFDPGAAKNLVQSQEFRQWAVAHGLPAQGKGVPQEFDNYLVNKSVVSHATGDQVGQHPNIPVSGTAGRSFWSNAAGNLPFIRAGGLVGGAAYGVSKGYDQLQRHSMDRIEQVFKDAAHSGRLNQIGMNTAPVDGDQTYMALQNLHDKVGQAVPPHITLNADQHLDLTMSVVERSQKARLPLAEVQEVQYTQFNGKDLINAMNHDHSKVATADIHKAIQTPAEQTLASLQQQQPAHSQPAHAHRMVA